MNDKQHRIFKEKQKIKPDSMQFHSVARHGENVFGIQTQTQGYFCLYSCIGVE